MFDYTAAMHNLISDISRYSPHFSHLQPQKMLVGLSKSKTTRGAGTYAKIISMRFENGSLFTKQKNKTYEIERRWHKGHEILYIIYFLLPRFQNLNFDEKMTTVFHELYHISPHFDGDIRRFPGTKRAHSCNKDYFDKEAGRMAQLYLETTPNKNLSDFLQMKFRKFINRNGQIIGNKIPIPNLIPVKDPVPAENNGQLVFVY